MVMGQCAWAMVICWALFDHPGVPNAKEIASSSGRFVFKILPDERGIVKGRCKGTLVATDEEREFEMWSRMLVNDESPIHVYVAESGKYVVTIDEWGRAGTNPLVIYDAQGNLVARHTLESLRALERISRDWTPRITVSSVFWAARAIMFFGPGDETFFIRLGSGVVIIVCLKDGTIVSEGSSCGTTNYAALSAYGAQRIHSDCLRMLASDNGHDRIAAAIVAGQARVIEAIPRLLECLAKEFAENVREGEVSGGTASVRKAAVKALAKLKHPPFIAADDDGEEMSR